MPANTLMSAVVSGVRPLDIKASLLSWLGVPISLQDGAFWGQFIGSENYAGKAVTISSMLQLSTAWACIRLISETLATLPVGLFKRLEDGSKESASRENLYYLLHTQPNADMTAATFWQVFVTSMLCWGDAYIEIIRSGTTITSLEFLRPENISWKRLESGAIEWTYFDPRTGKKRPIPDSRMWHTPAFSTDGIWGLSPIRYGANVFGNAMAAAQASGETFKSGMKSPGLVTMNAIMKPGQRDEVRGHVKKVWGEGGVMVLESGADYKPLAMNPQDAELLLTLGFSVEEICRWFGVPPFMVGHGEKSTTWGTGIEQQMIGFVIFVLRPWCVRIEQSIKKSLIPTAQRTTLFAEFALEGLLRGDSASRAAFYSAMVNNGIFTRDECRALENRKPMGGNADVLTVQTAMAPIDSLGMVSEPEQARLALMNWLSAGNPAKE